MHNGRYITDITIPDDSLIEPGTTFVKTWRVENNGSLPWEGCRLVFINGTAMTTETSQPLATLSVGQQMDVSLTLTAPLTAGTYFGDWRFQDSDGTFFGEVIFLRIAVPEPTSPIVVPPDPVPDRFSNGRYVADITIPDGTTMNPGAAFTKVWRVQNTGESTWGEGFYLVHEGGEPMTATTRHPLPAAAVYTEVDISLELTAPATAGYFRSDWRLYDAQDRPFGDLLYLEVNVLPPVRTAWTFNPPAWRATIWAITSVFESGRAEGDAAAYQTYDAGIISYGKHQATLASGNLGRVIEAYLARSRSAAAQAIQQEYLAAVNRRDRNLRADARLKELLLQAAAESAMSEAQDEVFDQGFYQPAVTRARSHNVTTPLGLACIYDTSIQGGVDQRLINVRQKLGGVVGENDIDEAAWIGAFLDDREAFLNRLADEAEARGDQANARALRISTFRVEEFRKLWQANNLTLEGELVIRGQTIVGISLTG